MLSRVKAKFILIMAACYVLLSLAAQPAGRAVFLWDDGDTLLADKPAVADSPALAGKSAIDIRSRSRMRPSGTVTSSRNG